jgi:hypothetical protein
MDQPLGDKVMNDIKSDFVVQGTHRIHNWYAYAIIGIVLGMALMIVYVANRQGQFSASEAAKPRVTGNTNQPSAIKESEKNTIVFDTFYNLAKEEGKKVTMVRVKPLADFKVIPGEDNDVVQLGDMVAFKLGTPVQLQTLKKFLLNQKFGYDFAFNTDATNPQWHLTFNAPLPIGADVAPNPNTGTVLTDSGTGNKVIEETEDRCTCGAYKYVFKFAKTVEKSGDASNTTRKPECNATAGDKGASQCSLNCGDQAYSDQYEKAKAQAKARAQELSGIYITFTAPPSCNNKVAVKAPAGR